MSLTDREQGFLRRAIELSAEKMREGLGGPFGAVIVKNGEIVAEGWNRVTSDNDPTAHAEVVAVRRAARVLGTFDLSGCVIYSSCEPCPMCLGAIYWARLDGLVYANTRDQAAAIGFDDAHFYGELAKPLSEQALPCTHLPSEEARDVFTEWLEKGDKTPY